MLSNMCQNIITDSILPGALEQVSCRSARRVTQSAQKEAWMGKRDCQDILSGILDNIDTILLFNIYRDIVAETVLPESELSV